MPFDVLWEERGIFRLRGAGPFDLQALEEARAELLAHARWEPGSAVVVDCRGMDFTPMTGLATVDRAAAENARHTLRFGEARVAAVVDSDLGYGLARQFEVLSEKSRGHQFAVFRDWDDAVAWATDS